MALMVGRSKDKRLAQGRMAWHDLGVALALPDNGWIAVEITVIARHTPDWRNQSPH